MNKIIRQLRKFELECALESLSEIGYIDNEPFILFLKDEFRLWLKEHGGKSDKTIEQYIKALEVVNNELNEDIFDIIDEMDDDELYDVYLDENGEWQSNGWYSGSPLDQDWHLKLLEWIYTDDTPNGQKDESHHEEEEEEEEEEVRLCDLSELEYLLLSNRDLAAELLYNFKQALHTEKQNQDAGLLGSTLRNAYTAFLQYRKFILTLMKEKSDLLPLYLPGEEISEYHYQDWIMLQEEVYLIEEFGTWLRDEKKYNDKTISSYLSALKTLYRELFYATEKEELQSLPRLLDTEPQKAQALLLKLKRIIKQNTVDNNFEKNTSKTFTQGKTAAHLYFEYIQSLIESNSELLKGYSKRSSYFINGDNQTESI